MGNYYGGEVTEGHTTTVKCILVKYEDNNCT